MKTDLEQVWHDENDLPSELAMFNKDNQEREKVKSENNRHDNRGELQMERKPSEMAAFNV